MILFLKPYFEIKPWAGKELNNIYDCPEKTGEAWIVSGYKNKSSIVTNGKFKGETLRHLWRKHPELFGEYPDKEFPVLLKLISSNEKLSVQVHPNDDYALEKHNSLGKFECWYILPETKATTATLGINASNSQELRQIIESGQIESYLITKDIHQDDLIIVEPGRIHALEGDSFVLEAQESSDITYRLYDYNRLPKREINLEDSLNVIDYNNDKNLIHPFKENGSFKNSHFDLYKINITGEPLCLSNRGFEIFYVIDGEGFINSTKIKKGDTFITTADQYSLCFKGNIEIIALLPKPKGKERLKMRKVALITGIVGQDGYYLTDLLLNKNYEVHGMVQSMNQYNSSKITEFEKNENFFIHIGDMTDTSNLNGLLEKIKPDEIYHLASQSHVDLSFDIPEYTAQVNALGTLRLLDAIKNSEIRTKLFHLSTPYLFNGDVIPQDENTPFDPKSPFAISKQYAHNMVKSYRDYFNLFAVNGICYNHTSPKADSFVLRKIIDGVKKIRNGEDYVLEMGNLDSIREMGDAKDYAYAMWATLQANRPDDYIISTKKGYTIREIVTLVFSKINISLSWKGEGLNEIAVDENNKTRVVVSPKLCRAYDPKVLVGNSSKLERITGFKLSDDLGSLIDSMMEAEKC